MPAGASLLIAGYYGFGNAGDEAILAAMLGELRALRPGLDVVVAAGDPAATAARHGVRAIPRDDLPALIDAIRASDLVILGGGGLFQDYWPVPAESFLTARQGGLPTYLAFPALAALMGRPSMLYAVGVGPLSTEEGRALTRAAFVLSSHATVRDPGSLALVTEILDSAERPPIELAADPAFLLPPIQGEALDALLAGIGVAPDEPLTGVALRPWALGTDPEAWEGEIGKALDLHLAGTPGRLLFLPFQPDEDLVVSRRVAARLACPERALVVARPLGAPELAGVLGRCERVLAMRFHAALFALAAGVPVASLAYDPKVTSLLAGAGLADLALPVERWRADEVAAALHRAGDGERREGLAPFAAAQRALARRSAVAALAALDAGPLPRSEGRRFLDDLALAKVAAVIRLEGERREGDRRERAAEAERVEAEGKLERLRQELEAQRQIRDQILAERNDLDRRLTAFERTLAYRLATRVWSLMRALFPEGSGRRRIYRLGRRAVGKMLGAPVLAPVVVSAGGGPDSRADLLRFAERVDAAGGSQVVAIFSGTQLLESEGQRPTQLALALARRGVPVVFVYWRWHDDEWRQQDRLEEGILQIPIDVVVRHPDTLTGAFAGRERIALFEFPYPGFFTTLSAANSAGWLTVYDAIDDWAEFHRVGQAIWFDEEFERHLIGGCDAVFAINGPLAGRVRDLGGPDVEILGNGLKPGIAEAGEPRPLARGEITVGYFGYLAGAWFDWELVAGAARRRPAWRFYLIGYGGSPEGTTLPANVELLGKQPQADLAAFAANWDVAVIPFKPDRLAAGADPIKTYEYLAMGLPVVVTGVYPPAGGEAFVARAEGEEELLAAVERAAGRRAPEEVAARRAFAATCTWDHRLEALLAALASGRQRVAEKRALFAEGG